jgi:hypothetical protein
MSELNFPRWLASFMPVFRLKAIYNFETDSANKFHTNFC